MTKRNPHIRLLNRAAALSTDMRRKVRKAFVLKGGHSFVIMKSRVVEARMLLGLTTASFAAFISDVTGEKIRGRDIVRIERTGSWNAHHMGFTELSALLRTCEQILKGHVLEKCERRAGRVWATIVVYQTFQIPVDGGAYPEPTEIPSPETKILFPEVVYGWEGQTSIRYKPCDILLHSRSRDFGGGEWSDGEPRGYYASEDGLDPGPPPRVEKPQGDEPSGDEGADGDAGRDGG